MHAHRWLSALIVVASGLLLAACGSRSGLDVPHLTDASVDIPTVLDATPDVPAVIDIPDVPVVMDVPLVMDIPVVIDVPPVMDVPVVIDVPVVMDIPDVPPVMDISDVAPVMDLPDVPPVMDVPTMDVFDASDVTDVPDVAIVSDVPQTCPDGGLITAYIWDAAGNLYTFDPATLAIHLLGAVHCPTTASPWTLSVSRAGFGYMVYEDWNIYRVDLTTLACTTTPFDPTQLGFNAEGEESIAISRDPTAPEQLYVYGMNASGPTLAVANLTDFVLHPLGSITPNPVEYPYDMQGDALGHLFALSESGLLLEIDASNAHVLVSDQTTFSGDDWAVMTYGSAIYFFGNGAVSSFDLATGGLTALGNVGVAIVGASAAPCIE